MQHPELYIRDAWHMDVHFWQMRVSWAHWFAGLAITLHNFIHYVVLLII